VEVGVGGEAVVVVVRVVVCARVKDVVEGRVGTEVEGWAEKRSVRVGASSCRSGNWSWN